MLIDICQVKCAANRPSWMSLIILTDSGFTVSRSSPYLAHISGAKISSLSLGYIL
jgi:hypothetical protein